MQQYDLIVIGAGPGGYKAAGYGVADGKRVAIIEKSHLGGTCLNRGCVPTKCLCAAADRILEIQHAADFGIDVTSFVADFSKAHGRAIDIIATLRDDVNAHLHGADIIEGTAQITGPNTVSVGNQVFEAKNIIIATGSQPAPFPAEGGEYTENSDDFLAREELPEKIAIVGGGVIGLEFASIISAYGKDVTIVEYCKEILPGFDSQIAKRLRTYMGRRGVKFILGARVVSVDSNHTITYEAKNKLQSLESDIVISAVGRRPVLPGGISDVGIQLTEKGFIAVDKSYETSVKGIYAIGDVNGTCMLAHAAYAQAAIVTGKANSTGVIPSIVFTNPECASVGITVDSIENLKSVTVPYSTNAKALASGESDGILKLVYNDAYNLVGCQAVGTHAADLVAEAAIAIDAAYDLRKFAFHSVSAHPSISEMLQVAAEAAV
ncbi:MAG: FAD-dependent oxidoreductase [Muribaculaceae bacterium]|nr:FAD-dependent oxidoreductase [Muribaculaceae bacterium]